VRFNNASQSAVTTIWFHYTTNDTNAVNLKTYWAQRVKAGDQFYFQDKDDPTKWQLYELNSAYTDSGTYATLAVTWKAGGSALTAARIIVTREGAPTTPTGSVAWGDVTGKPSTFPPTVPIAQADITGLVAELTALDDADTALQSNKLDVTGGTMTGKLNATSASPARAGFNVVQSASGPSSPTNGDLWALSTGLYVQIAGATVGPLMSSAAYTAADVLTKLLTVDGTTSALDADLLDGQHGTYYVDLTNATNTLAAARFTDTSHGARAGGTLHADVIAAGASGFMTGADKTKLNGVATGATANSADATLLARGNHTGTQSADTLTDGTTNKAFLATERTKLTGIATGATANSSDATLLGRANHTGTQTASTISDFNTAADARVALKITNKITVASSAPGSPSTNDIWIDTT
jgi:hypothetical protein